MSIMTLRKISFGRIGKEENMCVYPPSFPACQDPPFYFLIKLAWVKGFAQDQTQKRYVLWLISIAILKFHSFLFIPPFKATLHSSGDSFFLIVCSLICAFMLMFSV